MELETNRTRSKVGGKNEVKKEISVREGRLNSKNADAPKAVQQEVPSIRLSPEQIEEIHTDEYSLTLFYATRMEPLSLLEMKRQFPEPEPKKVQSVMDRYIKVGLVHITPEGKFYSNYPENYINYSHYRYDSDLEARKDSKVFQVMKEQTGKSEFWRDKTYFSMDAFYSEEQSKELLEMFKAIKIKAKEYANENAKKKSIKGLRFRRMKFFDMTFGLMLAILLSLGISQNSYAGAGGNDPTMRAQIIRNAEIAMARFSGGGNDPTGMMSYEPTTTARSHVGFDPINCGGGGHDPCECGPQTGGGGHDPADNNSNGPNSCVLKIEGRLIEIKNPRLCKLHRLIDFLSDCDALGEEVCNAVLYQIEGMVIELQSQRTE